MLIFLLGSAAVALAFVPVLVSSSSEPTSISTNVKKITVPVHGVCSIFMSALCVYVLIKKKKWKSIGRVQFIERGERRQRSALWDQHSLEDRQFQKMPILQIVVFGIGAGLWLLCRIIQGGVLFCTITDISYGEIISAVDDTLYLLSIAIQVVFLVHYDGAILPNTSMFHYSIALMIADKVWVWLTVTLHKIGDIYKEDELPIYSVGNFSGNISVLRNSSAIAPYTVFDVTSTFLQPFFIEYLTISIGVLVHLWNFIGKEHEIHDLLESHENDDLSPNERNNENVCVINLDRECLLAQTEASGECLSEEENHQNQIGVHLKIRSLLMGMFIIFITIVAACNLLSQLILGKEGPLHKLVRHLSAKTQSYLSHSIAAGVFFPVLVTSVVSLFKSYRNNSYWSTGFTSSDYLLFFTTIANFTFFILQFIAAATVLSIRLARYHLDQAIGRIIFAICCILQVWVQTQLLIASHSVRRQGRSISKLTKICLIYTISVNIAAWLQLAVYRESVYQI